MFLENRAVISLAFSSQMHFACGYNLEHALSHFWGAKERVRVGEHDVVAGKKKKVIMGEETTKWQTGSGSG